MVEASIIFQRGEFYNEGNSWIMELLITLVGAFFGGLISVGIFYIDLQRRRNSDIATHKKILEDRLMYFASLCNSVIELSKLRSKHIGEFRDKLVNEMETENFDIPSLTIGASNDLYRFTMILNPDDYFHPYLEKFKSKNNEDQLVNEFGKVFNNCDFLFRSFEELLKLLSQTERIQTEYKLKYRALIEQFMSESALYFRDHSDLFANFLNDSIYSYRTWLQNNGGSVRLVDVQKMYVDPIKIRLIQNDFRQIPLSGNLLLLLKEATHLLHTDLIKGFGYFVARIEEDLDDYIDGTEKLIKNTSRIVDAFPKIAR